MESSILFAQLVLGMCAIHLVRELSESLAKWWAKNRSEQSTKSTKKTIRTDWYVFFSCADLYGKVSGEKLNRPRKSTNKANTRRDTRPAVRV